MIVSTLTLSFGSSDYWPAALYADTSCPACFMQSMNSSLSTISMTSESKSNESEAIIIMTKASRAFAGPSAMGTTLALEGKKNPSSTFLLPIRVFQSRLFDPEGRKSSL